MTYEDEVEGKKIGEVTHYFNHIDVAVIKLEDNIQIGDKIKIKGATTDFDQEIESMQIEHEDVESAEEGQSVGTKVENKVREGDEVYLIE